LKNIENATAAFAALSTDPYADVAALSDRYIISEFRGYWQQLSSLEVPYHFFVADWDTEQTVVAYAQDQNGHEAKVARLGVTPVSAGDIEELRGYVEAVNNASAQAIAKSMVIAEVAEPTMECIWSQEVGAPRAGVVTYHEVEPLQAVASDLVKVGAIQSFRF
jgi:hypothetical protein